MAAMVGRLFALLEAQTAQFDARMDASAKVIDKMTRSQTLATRAAGQMRTSLQGLASSAFGIVGPAGQAAASLATLAGGMTALVAVAAAGGIAILLHKEGEEIKKWTESADKAAAAARGLAAARIGSPLLTRLAATEGLEAERAQLEEQIKLRASRIRHAFNIPEETPAEELAKADTQLEQMLRKLAALNSQITEVARQPESVLVEMNRQLQLIGLPLDQAAKLQAQWKGLVGEAVDEYVRLAVAIDNSTRALKDAEAASRASAAAFILDMRSRADAMGFSVLRGLRPRDFPGFNAPAITEPHFLPRDPFAGIATHFGRGTTPAPEKPGFRISPEFAIMSSMALLQGAQGGAAGLFGAAAGPLAMINPLAGAISAGIGGIFSLFDNAEERRHRQLVDTINKLGQEVGLDRVTVIFTGPDGHQIRKSLAELEEGDAVERVPGPVGAGG